MYPKKEVVDFEKKSGVRVIYDGFCSEKETCTIPARWARVGKSSNDYFKKGYMVILLGRIFCRRTVGPNYIPLVLKNFKAADKLANMMGRRGMLVVKICKYNPS